MVNLRGSSPPTIIFYDSNTAVKSLYPDGWGILKESWTSFGFPKVLVRDLSTFSTSDS